MLTSYVFSIHVQSKCDRLDSNIKELESLLTEMAVRNEELQGKLDEAAEKCHSMEVTSP